VLRSGVELVVSDLDHCVTAPRSGYGHYARFGWCNLWFGDQCGITG
jgi:hypothetical protein